MIYSMIHDEEPNMLSLYRYIYDYDLRWINMQGRMFTWKMMEIMTSSTQICDTLAQPYRAHANTRVLARNLPEGRVLIHQ